MIQAVIFDMEGLIIDSEPLQSAAWEEILKEYGKKPVLDELGLVHKIGVRVKDNWEILKKEYNVTESTDVLEEKRTKVYLHLLKKNLRPMHGFIQLINLLKKKKIKLAIASSSLMEHIESALSILNVREYFDVIVSGELVSRGKPFPDIFLEAAKRLNVAPENCLVLEDSQRGVEAAKNANMKVIAVPNRFTKNHDHSKADLIVKSLEKINMDVISAL